jgi:hypothetical protein
MRDLFTDGFNSFWHFVFGILGFYFWWVVLFFGVYQLKYPRNTNTLIDLTEFMLGYLVVFILYKMYPKN